MRRLAETLLWLGSGVALLATTQPWWVAGERTVASGTEATTGSSLALVLAALAGTFLSRFLRPVGRRIVLGLVVVLLGVAVTVAVTVADPAPLSGGVLADQVAQVGTAWRWVYLAGAALGAVGAVLSWFAPPRTTRSTPATPDPAMDAWKSLDAGEDPTVERPRAAGGGQRANGQE